MPLLPAWCDRLNKGMEIIVEKSPGNHRTETTGKVDTSPLYMLLEKELVSKTELALS